MPLRKKGSPQPIEVVGVDEKEEIKTKRKKKQNKESN